MNTGLLKRLPSFSFIFLLICTAIWLVVNQHASSLTHEHQRLSEEKYTLMGLTRKWRLEYSRTSADDASSPVQRIQQGWLQDYEKRIQEYKELFLIQNAIKQKAFNHQISELNNILTRINQYTRSYLYIAEQMNHRVKQ